MDRSRHRFLPRDHRPVTLDAQFTAGTINTRGELPAAERFFGGNATRSFIEGDGWMIRGDPLLRSFPQNRFARIEGSNLVGGDRFFSANLTLGVAVWGYPLVPREALDDPAFSPQIEFGLNLAELALRNEYLTDDPAFRRLSELVGSLPRPVAELKKIVADLRERNPAPEIADALDRTYKAAESSDENPTGALARVEATVNEITEDLKQGKPTTSAIRRLTVGVSSDDPEEEPIPSYIADLSDALTRLEGLLTSPAAEQIAARRMEVASTGASVREQFVALEASPRAAEADRKAKREMAYPRRVMDELTREANLVGVSPVAVFDVARLWQRGRGAGGVRYAAGGGVRVSVVSLDVTAGYAWNLRREPSEGRGALLFTIELSNLFR